MVAQNDKIKTNRTKAGDIYVENKNRFKKCQLVSFLFVITEMGPYNMDMQEHSQHRLSV